MNWKQLIAMWCGIAVVIFTSRKVVDWNDFLFGFGVDAEDFSI